MELHKQSLSFFRFIIVLMILAGLFGGPLAMAKAETKKAQGNCKVSLIKEGSITILFDADDEKQCEKMKEKDAKVTYTPKNHQDKAKAKK